jgi:hypothetical protein
LPGDRVELEVKYISGSENGKIYSGIGMVDGKKKISADFEGETIPFNEIEDIDEQKRFFKLLTREQ